jgi:hypothetical protein
MSKINSALDAFRCKLFRIRTRMREVCLNIRFSGVFLLVLFSIQNRATPAVRCAGADPPRLPKVVYVSPEGSDKGDCGQSTASPCKTIQQGIENCNVQNCGVLVRYGTYNTGKPIDVHDGVSLYGSCVFDETTMYRYRSTIIGNPAIQANGINKPTVLEGFVILGSAAVNPGQASVAVTVINSTGLVLRKNVIASGQGGKGGNGNTPAAGSGESGLSGNSTIGGAGGRACVSNPPPNGLGSGGKGANLRPITSTCDVFTGLCTTCNDRPEAPRPVGANGASSGSIPGGAGGGPGTPGCSCVVNRSVQTNAGSGSAGGSGNSGVASTQGGSSNLDTKGSFAGTTWRPNFGVNGAGGQTGSGGGGGGAGGFAATDQKGTNTNGFAGGGGGGGGCGGPGGAGAQQGGASIPLVLFASSVAELEANTFIPGPGGRGGAGGTGARGGNGGSGGAGFQGQQKVLTAINLISRQEVCRGIVPGIGGRGGNGGQGGEGAGGAGGNGGPSFAIALVNASPLSASGLIIYPAQPGPGGDLGRGGQNNATSKGGADGKPGIGGFSDNSKSIVSFTSTSIPTGANQ